MLTITEAVRRTQYILKTSSNSANLDAELLVAYACTMSRTQLYIYSNQIITEQQQNHLELYIKRRVDGEPLAYIFGEKEFWSLLFEVTSDTLIPRPETEHLIEWILENFSDLPQLQIADLGTGCGSIAIALASEQPNWHIDATDQSLPALLLAQKNAQHHQIENIHFYHGSWCAALPNKHYHIIVSNPPYISSLDPHLKYLKHEPQEALIAGNTGLEAICAIISEAKDYLTPSGYLVLEHGYDQGRLVLKQLEKAGFKGCQNYVDLASQPRFSVGHL